MQRELYASLLSPNTRLKISDLCDQLAVNLALKTQHITTTQLHYLATTEPVASMAAAYAQTLLSNDFDPQTLRDLETQYHQLNSPSQFAFLHARHLARLRHQKPPFQSS